MSQSKKMNNALECYVIPEIKAKGFIGNYPHYKREYDNRIELMSFQTNKYGDSFTIEVSIVFKSTDNRDSNFVNADMKDITNATVGDTNIRYRLKGMYDGWFYYTDLYCQKIGSKLIYNSINESKSDSYIPSNNEKLIQKANDDLYKAICLEVNKQLLKAYKWLNAYNRNNRIAMKILEL